MLYEQRLRAIGRLLDQSQMNNVALMEFEAGVLVVGTATIDTKDSTSVTARSVEYDNALIERVVSQLEQESPSPHSPNDRQGVDWFRRNKRQ